MSRKYLNKHGYDAFYEYSIAFTFKNHFTFNQFGVEPHATLAPFNDVLRYFVFVNQRLQGISQVNKQGVFVHPVFKLAELLYYFVLNFVDCHVK